MVYCHSVLTRTGTGTNETQIVDGEYYTYLTYTAVDEVIVYPDPLEMDKPWKDKRKPKFMKNRKNRK